MLISERTSLKAQPRVCPKCYKMWATEGGWLEATDEVALESRVVGYRGRQGGLGSRRCNIVHGVREHVDCGGRMLDAGRVATDVAVCE